MKQSILVYENHDKPFGISFAEWTVRWWKWITSIPRPMNPGLNYLEEFCAISQNDPLVWFLAGKFGGKLAVKLASSTIRRCRIPRGRAILFPVINCEYSFADEPSITTEGDLEERCRSEIDDIVHINASLNGRALDVKRYRVQTPCFTLHLPPENCVRGISGTTRMASDGFWLFIAGLPCGTHRLESFGSCLAGRINISNIFELRIE